MTRLRILILAALALVLGGSGYFYVLQKRYARTHRVQAPPMLPADTNSNAIDYEWAQSSGGFASVQVKAKTFRQVRDTPDFELGGLELRLTQKDHQHYDLIKSSSAQFNKAEGRMYADGAVEITLDVPLSGTPTHELTSITTSGVRFDSKTGRATTDRPASFKFSNGNGKCTGATYDPQSHELHLVGSPALNLTSKTPGGKDMHVFGGEITYKEHDAVVLLAPWSRMVKGETSIDAGASIVKLKDEQVSTIDAQNAHGTDIFPKRKLSYGADSLHVSYNDDGDIQSMTGDGNARLHEESGGAVIDTRSHSADLGFTSVDGENVLQHAVARGDAVAESKPGPDSSGKISESRILKSDTIDIAMRPGGREIEKMQTNSAGTLEFIPNAPDQHRRLLNADRMTIAYGERNLLKSYEATHAATVTYPAANTRTKNPAPSKTTSEHLMANFDERGQLASMKQWERFNYQEGDRRATAATATLDQKNNAMDLETEARVWDASGSTDADRIHLLEKTGDYSADGHVKTSRLPEQDPKKKQTGEMLDGDEPIEGTASHMTSANHNKLVRYEGGAVLWQSSDRIEAQTIDVDRDKHTLFASDKVNTQFLDTKASGSKQESTSGAQENSKAIEAKASGPLPAEITSPSSPTYTVVRSDKLVYTDTDRLAHYTGAVELTRPGLTVRSADLRAFLNPRDTKEDSRLNRAVGDGSVEIVEKAPTRQRTGRGDHGEYITSEDKVVLRGNSAEVFDFLKKDESHGVELTYFTSDDRLLIKGAPSKPVDSRLHRKPRAHANSGNR